MYDRANTCRLTGFSIHIHTQLKLMWMEERALLELQDRGAALTLTLHGPDYLRGLETGGGASGDPLAHLWNLDGLRRRLREGLLQPLLPQLAGREEEAATAGGVGRGAERPSAPMVCGWVAVRWMLRCS